MSRKNFQRLSLDERRRSLLEATLECIAEQGLDGASARRIAEKANVTAGLIRHYFGSKDDMVLAAYGYLVGQMTTQAEQAAADAGKSPERRLAQFVVANVTPPNLSARKVSLWATFIGRIRATPRYADIHRESYREFLSLLETMVHAVLAARQRPAPPDICQAHAIALNGLIDGLWLEGSLSHGLYSIDRLPRIALGAAEGILALPAGDLLQYLDFHGDPLPDRN
ncbi:TetR family transcriptional regulator C-terminal domain-containing protein [Salinicola aestuarinus]|uniref:TetR family transcriptional regulator C-terminal domain-containing protein n=1 Tax=Salinicola aestuarinus TaxID=1949082 RepID=UPI000DA204FF|nr:TetR family transcriptional regulator C-terminal domain-containing protein [Salinicola aestuarinus]